MRSTNELPRPIARARGAADRARSSEDIAAYFARPGRGWPDGVRKNAEQARYEWARAAAALLAWLTAS